MAMKQLRYVLCPLQNCQQNVAEHSIASHCNNSCNKPCDLCKHPVNHGVGPSGKFWIGFLQQTNAEEIKSFSSTLIKLLICHFIRMLNGRQPVDRLSF